MKYTSGMRSFIDIINESDGEQHRTNMTPAEHAHAMNVLTRYSERRAAAANSQSELEADDNLTIKNDRAFGGRLPDEPVDYDYSYLDNTDLAVSDYTLKNDPNNELGYTPGNTEPEDIILKTTAERLAAEKDPVNSYKLTTPVTGSHTDSDGKISHITANPDGTGKVDTSVQSAIEYTKRLKADLAVKKAAADKIKAKKDKKEVEVATARFMASKEAKAQRDIYNKRHSKEHTYAKNIQTGRARYLAMKQKQEEEMAMRRNFLRKQQIENQKKQQAYYNSMNAMYGRRPYR
jgi:hypothetical protein